MANDGGPAYPIDSFEMKCPTCDGTATKDDQCSKCGVQGVIYKDYLGMSFRDVAEIAAMHARLTRDGPSRTDYDEAQAKTDERQRRLDDEHAG